MGINDSTFQKNPGLDLKVLDEAKLGRQADVFADIQLRPDLKLFDEA